MDLSYDINGNATENYTLTADNKTWFLNDYACTRVYKPLFTQIVWTNSGLGFINLSSSIPNGSTVLAIGINNNILRNKARSGGTSITSGYFNCYTNRTATGSGVVSGAFYATAFSQLSTPWVSTTSGSSDRVWIVYKSTGRSWEADPGTENAPGFELEAPSGAHGATRRGYITPYLFNSGIGTTASGRALRLQNVAINVAPTEDKLYELGTDGFYGVVKNTPIPVNVTITANDTDLEYFAMMCSTVYSRTSVKTLNAADFCGTNLLRVYVYSSKTKGTLLKTVEVRNMYPTGDNWTISVGGYASHELTFTADNIKIVGSGTNIIGGHNNA